MKWRNEELSKNGKIKLVFISIFVAILIAVSVFVSVIYLTPIYEKYKIDYVKKAVLVLENYINFHLDTNINAQKILWGALLW